MNSQLLACVFFGLTITALVEPFCRNSHAADVPAPPKAMVEALDLRSDGLPTPLVIPGDALERLVTAIEIQGELLNGGDGKGTVTLDERPFTFNEFGDAKTVKAKLSKPHPVEFKKLEQGAKNEDRRLYELVFDDNSFPKRMHLVLSGGTTGPHRLLIRSGDRTARDGVIALDQILELQGSPEITAPLPDASLGANFNVSALSSGRGHADGGLQRVTIGGTTNGPASLSLDPNHLSFNAFGDVVMSTLIGYRPISVTLKRIDIQDPTQKGRLLFEILTEGDRLKGYFLVLSSGEGGPHRMLIRKDDKLQYVLPLTDLNRQYHLKLQSQLAACSSQEQQAVKELRTAIGYSFRLKIESGAITEVQISSGADAERVDSALNGLTNLKSLDFGGSRLGAAGLTNLRHLVHLESLRFSSAEITDEGLKSLRHMPGLRHLIFYSCRGITDEGLAHLQGLSHLKHLQLYREDFPKPGQPAAKRITDAGLERLKGLTELEYLNLMGQTITDSGLERLKGLTKLNELYLSGDGITDAGLEHLKVLSKLKHLHLYNTRVTPAGEAGLKSKLPMLRIGG